jgi:exo-beta-1,3-glucanase (GH17 family)
LIVRRFALLLAAVMAFGAVADAASPAPPLDSISYTPSHAPTFADLAQVSDARLRADLAQLAPLCREIRIYSADPGMQRVPPIAAKLGLKVILGAWLDTDEKANDVQVAAVIAMAKANPGVVSRIIVGNETIQFHRRPVSDVITAMAKVRDALGGSIPVGTAEIWSIWGAHPELAAASDFIGAHILPYWDGVSVDEAPAYVMSRRDELAARFPGKPIWIAETGWPTSGPTRQGAVLSPGNQARFISAFAKLAAQARQGYSMFEAYDEPWKAAGGDTPLWGLFDINATPKPVVRVLTKP